MLRDLPEKSIRYALTLVLTMKRERNTTSVDFEATTEAATPSPMVPPRPCGSEAHRSTGNESMDDNSESGSSHEESPSHTPTRTAGLQRSNPSIDDGSSETSCSSSVRSCTTTSLNPTRTDPQRHEENGIGKRARLLPPVPAFAVSPDGQPYMGVWAEPPASPTVAPLPTTTASPPVGPSHYAFSSPPEPPTSIDWRSGRPIGNRPPTSIDWRTGRPIGSQEYAFWNNGPTAKAFPHPPRATPGPNFETCRENAISLIGRGETILQVTNNEVEESMVARPPQDLGHGIFHDEMTQIPGCHFSTSDLQGHRVGEIAVFYAQLLILMQT
jgi:hypothetical protein